MSGISFFSGNYIDGCNVLSVVINMNAGELMIMHMNGSTL